MSKKSKLDLEIERDTVWWVQEFDPDQKLSMDEIDDVIATVTNKVKRVMAETNRTKVDPDDNAYIERRVRELVKEVHDHISHPTVTLLTLTLTHSHPDSLSP